MIPWGWLILAFTVGFFIGALIIRYKGNKDMESLATEVKEAEEKVKELKEKINEQYSGSH